LAKIGQYALTNWPILANLYGWRGGTNSDGKWLRCLSVTCCGRLALEGYGGGRNRWRDVMFTKPV
jgi:hypothetical protein